MKTFDLIIYTRLQDYTNIMTVLNRNHSARNCIDQYVHVNVCTHLTPFSYMVSHTWMVYIYGTYWPTTIPYYFHKRNLWFHCSLLNNFWNIKQQCAIKPYFINKRRPYTKLTSAHAFGRTRRPMRPASLALRTFSNNGTIVEFELHPNYS